MVLSAGEVCLTREADPWTVSEVGNPSTGYCPDVRSWVKVARAPDAVELRRPSGFTHEVVLRRCPDCVPHRSRIFTHQHRCRARCHTDTPRKLRHLA